ncbi:hypothetical protein MASR1M90_23230 [Desulfovibrionales bacterium]
MKITCPNCGFTRNVDETALSPRAAMATCPQCTHRFKFRDITPAASHATGADSAPTLPKQPMPAEQPHPEPRPTQHDAEPPHSVLTPADPPHDDDLWKELEAFHHDADQAQENSPCFVLPAWEKADTNYPQAFVQTFVDVLSKPKTFFQFMPVGQGYVKPLLFFLILVEIIAISQAVWQLFGILPASLLTEGLGHTLQAAIALILYPVEITAFLILDATINHTFLRLLRADTKGFEGTFRASTYSAAPMLLSCIPYIGLPLAMIGTTIYKYLGLRYVHNASPKQVIAALTIPVLLTMAIAVLSILLTGSA